MHSSFLLVPITPSGFVIVRDSFTPENNTVTFEWDPPQGMGPELVVDHYRIIISPAPLSHTMVNLVESSPWNVILDYNIIYTANITAINCAGETGAFSLDNIEYSEYCFVLSYNTHFSLFS